MTKKPSRPRDANELAKLIVDIATGEKEDVTPAEPKQGQAKGGRIGGKARAESLTAEQRSDIARKAAKARWS